MATPAAAHRHARAVRTLELTDADLGVVRSALEAYLDDFSHEEPDVIHRIHDVIAKVERCRAEEATMGEHVVGRVTHYYGRVGAAAISLSDRLSVGDRVRIVGHTTDEVSIIDRMQVEHRDVPSAGPGDDVAVHLPVKVREHDEVRKAD